PDALAFLVVPGAGADAITCIHRIGTLCTEVRVPRGPAASGGGREGLAICVRAGQSSVVSAITFSNTGDEETHGLRWGLGRASAPDSQAARVLRNQNNSAHSEHHQGSKNSDSLFHHFSPFRALISLYVRFCSRF